MLATSSIEDCCFAGTRSVVNGLFRALRVFAPVIGQCFWASMGFIHVFALIATWRSYFDGGPDASGFVACITLSLAMLFFVLKVGGASCLRFHPSKRAWVAAFLLVAWIHIDSIDPNVTGILAGDCTDLLATTMLLGGLTEAPKAARAALDRSALSFKLRVSTGRSGEIVWLNEFEPRCWVLASRLFSLRAPPA